MGMRGNSKWGSGSLVVDESSGEPELKWRVNTCKKAPFGGWRQRQDQREYLFEHEDEIVEEFYFGLSTREIAKKHRLNLALLERWFEDLGLIGEKTAPWWEPPPIEIPKLPDPPVLEVGKKYALRDEKEGRFEKVVLRFLGTQPGQCIGGVHYLFEGGGRSKYCYHIMQLKENFIGPA